MASYAYLNRKCDNNCWTCFVLDTAVRYHEEEKHAPYLGNSPDKIFNDIFQLINNKVYRSPKKPTECQNVSHTEVNSAPSMLQPSAETLHPASSTRRPVVGLQSNAAKSSTVSSQSEYIGEVSHTNMFPDVLDVTSNISTPSILQSNSDTKRTILDTSWQSAMEEENHTIECFESSQFDSSTVSTRTELQDLETNIATLQPPVPAMQSENSEVDRLFINTESSTLNSPKESVKPFQGISKSPVLEHTERIDKGTYFILQPIVQPPHANGCFPLLIPSSTLNNSMSNILQILPINDIAYINSGKNITDQQENGLCSEMDQDSGLNYKNYYSQNNESVVEGIRAEYDNATSDSIAEKIDDTTDRETLSGRVVPSLVVSLDIDNLDCSTDNNIDRDDISHISDADNDKIGASGKRMAFAKTKKKCTKNSKQDCKQNRKSTAKPTAKGSTDTCSSVNNQLDCRAIREVKTKSRSDIDDKKNQTLNIGCKNKSVNRKKKSMKKQHSYVPKVAVNKIHLRSHTKKMSDSSSSATNKALKTIVDTNTDEILKVKKKVIRYAKTKNIKLKQSCNQQASMKIETYKKLFGIDDELSQLMTIVSTKNENHKSVIINPVRENTSQQLIDATLSIRKLKHTEDVTVSRKKQKLMDETTDGKSNQNSIEKGRLMRRILNYESLMSTPEIFQNAIVQIERLKPSTEIIDTLKDSTSTNKRKRFISSSDESTGSLEETPKKRKLTGNGKRGRKISLVKAIKLYSLNMTSFEQSDPEESSVPDDKDGDENFPGQSDEVFISNTKLISDQPAKQKDKKKSKLVWDDDELSNNVSDTETIGDQSTIGLENVIPFNEQPALEHVDINTDTLIETDDIAQQNISSQTDIRSLRKKSKDKNEHQISPFSYLQSACQLAVTDKSKADNDTFKTLINDNARSTLAAIRLIPKEFSNIHRKNILLSKENKLILYQFNHQWLKYVDTSVSFALLREPLVIPNIYLHNLTPKLLLNSSLINTSLVDFNYLFKNNILSVRDEKGFMEVQTPWTLTFSGNTINICESFSITGDIQSRQISYIKVWIENSNRLKAKMCPKLGMTAEEILISNELDVALKESNTNYKNSQDCVIIEDTDNTSETENKDDIVLIGDHSEFSEEMIIADLTLLPKLEPVQFIEASLNTIHDNISFQDDTPVPSHHESASGNSINKSDWVAADAYLSEDIEDHIQDNVIKKSTMRVVQSKAFTSSAPVNSINEEVFNMSSANKALLLSHYHYCLEKIKTQNVFAAALQSAPQVDVLDLSQSGHNSTSTADSIDSLITHIPNDFSEKPTIPTTVEKQSYAHINKCTPDVLRTIEVENSTTVDGINDADTIVNTIEPPLGLLLLSKTVEKLSDRINHKPFDTSPLQSFELNKNTTLSNNEFELESIKTEVIDNETNDDTPQIAATIDLTEALSTDIECLTEGIFLEMKKHNWRHLNKTKTKNSNESQKMENGTKQLIDPLASQTIEVTPAKEKEDAKRIFSNLCENLSDKIPSESASVISPIPNKKYSYIVMRNKKLQTYKIQNSLNKLNFTKKGSINHEYPSKKLNSMTIPPRMMSLDSPRVGISGLKKIKISEKILEKISEKNQYKRSQTSLDAKNHENIDQNTITNNPKLQMTPLKLSRIPGSIRSYRIEKKVKKKLTLLNSLETEVKSSPEDKLPSLERLNNDNKVYEGSFNGNYSVNTDQQTGNTSIVETAPNTLSSILSTKSANNYFINTFHEVDIDMEAEKNKNSSTVSTAPEFKSRILEDIVLVSAKKITPRCETSRWETPKCETSRCETPKSETLRCETSRCETPICETPRCETPRCETSAMYSNTSHHLVRSIAQKNRSHKAMPLVNPDKRQPVISQHLLTARQESNIIICNSKSAPLERTEIESIRVALPNTNISISPSGADKLHTPNIICNPRSDNTMNTYDVSQNTKASSVVPDISVSVSLEKHNIKTHIFQPNIQPPFLSKSNQIVPIQHRFAAENPAQSNSIQTRDSIRNQDFLAVNIIPEQAEEMPFRSPSPSHHRRLNDLLVHNQMMQNPQFNDASVFARPPPPIPQHIYGYGNLPQYQNTRDQQVYFNPNYALPPHENRSYRMKMLNSNSTMPVRQPPPYPGYGGRLHFESPVTYMTPNRPYYHPCNSMNRNIHPHYPNLPDYSNYRQPPPPL